MKIICTVLAIFVISSVTIAQTTYYVNNVTGSDANDGLTSATAKKTIVNAMAMASSGGTISVAATGQTYADSVVVTTPLTFASTNGKPQLSYLKVNLVGLPIDQVTFTGGFLVQTLVLSAGKIYGSDSLTITSNGKIVRQSANAEVLQQLKFSGQILLEYKGTNDINMGFEMPATDSTVLLLTLNFDPTVSTPRLTMNRSFFVRNVNFINGLLVTGPYIIHLDNPVGSSEQGFTKSREPSNTSHVLGNVRKTLKAGTWVALGRNEFPVGNPSFYRPLAFTISNFAHDTSLGVNVIVSEEDNRPTGIVGLPIANGIDYGKEIVQYPDFYWNVKPDSTIHNIQHSLEVGAQGFLGYDNFSPDNNDNLRIIKRKGTINSAANPWKVVGPGYDNITTQFYPQVCALYVRDNIEEAIFTFGLASTLPVVRVIPSQVYLSSNNPTYKRYLKNTQLLPIGPITFTCSTKILDPLVATAVMNGDTLIVTRKSKTGTTLCRVISTDSSGSYGIAVDFSVTNQSTTSSVSEPTDAIPARFSLSQNYPNPFNPSTTIEFTLPQVQSVKLAIYNMLGEEVERLVDNTLHPRSYKINWDATRFASGVYFYRLQTRNFVETKKLILLK